MRLSLPNLLAPHYCTSCGQSGGVLCEYCKYDIVSDPFAHCIVCLGIAPASGNLCKSCAAPYSRAWCVGNRSDALECLINAYKFDRVGAAGEVFAQLLDATLPQLPAGTVVTYVPTIPSHIRQRGYDHAAHIAKKFAKTRGLRYSSALARAEFTHQRGSGRAERIANAKRAFLGHDVDPDATYLLIDDIYTTGATLHYASKTLLDAGASEVFIAVVARQPLEKSTDI